MSVLLKILFLAAMGAVAGAVLVRWMTCRIHFGLYIPLVLLVLAALTSAIFGFTLLVAALAVGVPALTAYIVTFLIVKHYTRDDRD